MQLSRSEATVERYSSDQGYMIEVWRSAHPLILVYLIVPIKLVPTLDLRPLIKTFGIPSDVSQSDNKIVYGWDTSNEHIVKDIMNHMVKLLESL